MNPAPVPSIGLLWVEGKPNTLPCDGGVYACVLAPSLIDLELDANGGEYVVGTLRHYTLNAEAP